MLAISRRFFRNELMRRRVYSGATRQGDNTVMTDVSIYVAVISAAAGIVGAAVPQVSTAIRDGRRAERHRQERIAGARQQACVQLLDTVLNLRVHVADYYDYYGDEMATRLAEIRQYAANAQVEALRVGLMVPVGGLEKAAERLAEAAGRLADTAASVVGRQLGASAQAADFGELDECTAAFRALAKSDGRG
jgi:hypothetical protein